MACTACIVVFYLMHSCAYSSLPPLICWYFSLGKTELDLLFMIWLHVMWLYQSISNCSHNAWRIPPLMCHTIICSFPISCCLSMDAFSFCRHYLFSIVLHVFGQSVNFWAGTSNDYFLIQLMLEEGGRASVLCLWCCTSSSPHTLLLNHIIIEYQLVNIMRVKTLSRWQRFDVLGLAKWRRLSDLSTAQKTTGNTRS